jgi:ABC-type lipoprotein export system ATPase subunit/GNAT superfamily N-acetyltransferase
MPHFDHVIEAEYKPTFRTEKVVGMFDVPAAKKLRKEWHINMPIEEKPWQIGLIVGASGAGKTTIAKRSFGDAAYHQGYAWAASSLLDDFDQSLSASDITNALSHVGFSSPPAWLLPYGALSNGQKFRCELARCLTDDRSLIVFDEFTSVVDRNVAKVGSHAVQKAIRKTSKQFVAVTCHYDVEGWLQPDWVYDVSASSFKWRSESRSSAKIEIFRCHHNAWRLFAGNHYLSADINKASTCFVLMFDGEPAAFTAILPFPHPKVKDVWKEHRTVTLPDYQGFGLGNMLSEFVGEWLHKRGKKFRSVTSHPAMIGHRHRSSAWIMDRAPSRVSPPGNRAKTQQAKSMSVGRLTASFLYVPQNKRETA